MSFRIAHAVVIGALLVTSCGSETPEPESTTVTEPPATEGSSVLPETPPSEPSDTAPTPPTPATSTPTSPTAAPTAPASPAEPAGRDVTTAVADLASRLDVEPESIEVVAVENVTWRDGAIGCPQRDFAYTQATVDGVRIQLDIDGRFYQYHAGGGRDAFYCADPESPVGE